MDDLNFLRPKRRQLLDIPLAPILDMLVAVIFFLLLSTTFVAYTKQNLPPAKISTATGASAETPLAPKLLVFRNVDQVMLVLSWQGSSPGETRASLRTEGKETFSAELFRAATELVAPFAEKNVAELSVRLGLSDSASFQDMITVMDAIVKSFPEIVLISYEETRGRIANL